MEMDGDEPSRTNVVIIGAQVSYPLLVPNLRNSLKYIVCIPETVYFIFSIYWKFLTEYVADDIIFRTGNFHHFI